MRVPLTVRDFLDRAETVAADRLALVDEPDVEGSLGRLTYGELAARARGLARWLQDRQIAPGDRVALVSPNSGKFLASFFGVSGFGRILVPVNYRLTAAEIGYVLEHSGSRVLLVDPEIADSLADLPIEHRVVLDGTNDAELFVPRPPSDAPDDWEPDEDAVCSVNYTSGTTSRPKGVRLTHRNCWLNATTFGWHTTVTDRDVLLHTLPMFHCNGWGMPYAVTGMAGRHVVQRRIDGHEILRRIAREGVTLLCAAPAVVSAVLTAADDLRERGEAVPGRDRTRLVVAGAPPPSRTIERVETELGWEFIQIYGLTETSPLVTVNRAPAAWDGLPSTERARRLSRAGLPAIGCRVRTSDDGEVLTRSNHVFDGYWDQPAESAAVLVDGWFHTGDGGYLDGPYLVIADRKKDVIITGGENVSSIEVEDCLYQHPGVAEVAVIGVPDERWGETVVALVVPAPGAAPTERELIDFCRERMAHFKCPTSVEFRESLPRTATGKLQKFKLREPFWAGHERRVN